MVPARHLIAAGLLACFVAAVGAAPHVWYGRHAGDASYFKSAYDEGTYLRVALAGGSGAYRASSVLGLKTLIAIAGRPDTALAAADAIFPFAAALAAFAVAMTLTPSLAGRLLVALLLIFGQELGSFGCSAVTHLLPPQLNVQAFRSVGPIAARLVPDYYTSYFSIYRTPEPQVSLSVIFAALALLIVSVRRDEPSRAVIAGLCVLHAMLPWTYVFVALPLVMLEGLLIAGFVMAGRRRHALLVGSAVAVAMLAFSAQALAGTAAGGAPGTAGRHLFHSHLPTLTPSFFYSVTLLVLCGLLRKRVADARLFDVALACGAVPLVLMEQQIVTGLMISTRDFERYATYPLLVLGSAALTAAVRRTSRPSRRVAAAATLAIASIAIVVVQGQQYTVDAFRGTNDRALAGARALRTALASSPTRRVVIRDIGLVPDVAVRLNPDASVNFVLDYGQIPLFAFVGDRTPEERAAARYYRERSFEYFARLRQLPVDVSSLLMAEQAQIGSGSVLHLQMLFPIGDVWYPFSDDRTLNPDGVSRGIPAIVAAYGAYLDAGPAPLQEPALIVVFDDEIPKSGFVSTLQPIASGTAGSAHAVVYEQPQAPQSAERVSTLR